MQFVLILFCRSKDDHAGTGRAANLGRLAEVIGPQSPRLGKFCQGM